MTKSGMKERTDVQLLVLTDANDEFGPPASNVLLIGLSGPLVFLEIGPYDETHDVRTVKSTVQYAIDYEALVKALEYLKFMEDRVNAKP